MKPLSNILAGICAALFVLTAVAALFLFNIERRAFSSEPYKRAFERLGLYDRMPSILASSLFSTPASVNGTENPVWGLISSQGVESGLEFLLPPAELKAMTDGSLDSVFAYINGEADSAAIPLGPIKDHLASDAGVAAALRLLQTQPACTTDQLFQMTLGALTGSGFALCSPPPEAVALFEPLIQSQLQFTASLLPNEITIIPSDRSGTENDPRLRLNRLRAVMKITPFLPVLLLLVIVILVVRDLNTFLNWWGVPILVTGIISLPLALLGAPLIGFVIQFLIETQAEQFLSTVLLATLRETTTAVAREILTPIVVQSAILAGIGFMMVLTAFLLRKRTQLSTP